MRSRARRRYPIRSLPLTPLHLTDRVCSEAQSWSPALDRQSPTRAGPTSSIASLPRWAGLAQGDCEVPVGHVVFCHARCGEESHSDAEVARFTEMGREPTFLRRRGGECGRAQRAPRRRTLRPGGSSRSLGRIRSAGAGALLTA
jgi:hypothetical protein